MDEFTKDLFEVLWLGDTKSSFEIELTSQEKEVIEKFISIATNNVADYDMPAITINKK